MIAIVQWHKRIMCRNTPRLRSYEPFCLTVAAIAQAHDPTVIASVALWRGLRRLCLHRSDCCRALMLTCRNSRLWLRCERCNNVLSSFWPPWLDQLIEQRGHHVTCALIGTSHKFAAYNYTRSLELWTTLECELMDANGGIRKVRVGPATRSAVATCIIRKHIFSEE